MLNADPWDGVSHSILTLMIDSGNLQLSHYQMQVSAITVILTYFKIEKQNLYLCNLNKL